MNLSENSAPSVEHRNITRCACKWILNLQPFSRYHSLNKQRKSIVNKHETIHKSEENIKNPCDVGTLTHSLPLISCPLSTVYFIQSSHPLVTPTQGTHTRSPLWELFIFVRETWWKSNQVSSSSVRWWLITYLHNYKYLWIRISQLIIIILKC